MKRALFGALGVLALFAGVAVDASPSPAADHLEAPLVQLDGRTDINDLFIFESPTDPDNTVVIMTVNPGAGVISGTTFDDRAKYRFEFDTDGDAKRERRIDVRFGPVKPNGEQRMRIRGHAGLARGDTNEVISLPGGGTAWSGTTDDPFFFDFQAFQDQVKGAGGSRAFCDGSETDFFAGLNVSAIVLEVPTSRISNGETDIGVWAETRGLGSGRIDRMGRPAIATALIDDGREDTFNRRPPRRDVIQRTREVTKNLIALSAGDGTPYTAAEADFVASVLLPDILTVDLSAPAAYLNGRALADDVMDTSLFAVTGGFGADGSATLTTDCVDANDVPFPGTFPYLAPAHP